VTPAEASARPLQAVIAGSQAEALASNGGSATALSLLPDARQALLVPLGALTSDLAPLYGRPPDARLPGAAR
jgi:tRNA threonylcarbamoyladenosine biosynthesis protein TsaB